MSDPNPLDLLDEEPFAGLRERVAELHEAHVDSLRAIAGDGLTLEMINVSELGTVAALMSERALLLAIETGNADYLESAIQIAATARDCFSHCLDLAGSAGPNPSPDN